MNLSVASQSFAILVREGLEALLIVAALAGFLRKAGAADRIRDLYAGAGAALVASLLMAWMFVALFDGVHSDLLEAGVMAVAAVLLLSVSGWLLLRQDPRAWQARLDRMAGRALGRGTARSLALLSFVAVFREGAETVLFLIALASSSGGWSGSLLVGLTGATVVLAAVFGLVQWLAVRLPLRPIFLLTSGVLFLIAIRLVGEAVAELQEQGLVAVTSEGVPAIVPALGFNGSWESLCIQGLVILAAGLTTSVVRRNAARPSAAAAIGAA